MKHRLISVLLFAIILALHVANGRVINSIDQIEKRPFGFDDVIQSSKFSMSSFNGTWVSSTAFIYRNRDGSIMKFDIQTGEDTIFLSIDKLEPWKAIGQYSIIYSPDFKKLLIRYDIIQVYRHSTLAKCDVYDIETENVIHIGNEEHLQLCRWSPTSAAIVYVVKNNLYINRLTSTNEAITTNGVDRVIYNGVADWVYEEEVFGTDGAIWISPNGEKMAFAYFDDTNVKEFTYETYGTPGSLADQYPEYHTIRYPKPGTENPNVRLKLVDIKPESTFTESILDAPINIVGEDHVLGTVFWINNDNLGVIWQNRRQNLSSCQKCITTTGACSELWRHEEPSGWIDLKTPICDSTGANCYYIKSYEDYPTIHKFETAAPNNPVPAGVQPRNATVISINGFKESTNEFFFSATEVGNPNNRHVYKNDDCLSCNIKSPEGNLCTYASASFSTDYSVYALVCTGPDPSFTRIIQNDVIMASWQLNLEARRNLDEFELPKRHYLNVPVDNGKYNASVVMIMPPEIDIESDQNPAQAYPMIVYIYVGPNSVRVNSAFSVGYDSYLVTSHKVIYCLIDGRGTGYKGDKMLFEVNNRLGTVEIEDVGVVTRYLREKYNFIARDRIGVWGWSYGGYATSMVLAKDTGRTFQCGISVAPVTSWIYYDSIYTERYMGTPQDNEIGYQNADVTQNVEEFKNHDFLLIHGNADDNVHFQQSLALSKKLQSESIVFEQMSYPDEAHGLTGVSKHLYHTMAQFWVDCLNLNTEN